MSYTLPLQLDPYKKIYSIIKEFVLPEPTTVKVNKVDIKVGHFDLWLYDISLHWEFWSADGSLIGEEIVYNFYNILSNKWISLNQNMSHKEDITRITMLTIVHSVSTAEEVEDDEDVTHPDHIPVQFNPIISTPGIYLSTEGLAPITTEGDKKLLIEIPT